MDIHSSLRSAGYIMQVDVGEGSNLCEVHFGHCDRWAIRDAVGQSLNRILLVPRKVPIREMRSLACALLKGAILTILSVHPRRLRERTGGDSQRIFVCDVTLIATNKLTHWRSETVRE